MKRNYPQRKELPAPCIICGEPVFKLRPGTRLIVCSEEHREIWRLRKVIEQNNRYNPRRRIIIRPSLTYTERRPWEKRDCAHWEDCLTVAAKHSRPRVCEQVCGKYEKRMQEWAPGGP